MIRPRPSVRQSDACSAEQSLWRALPGLFIGTASFLSKDVTHGNYFGARKLEDGRIDFAKPAKVVYNLIRAVAPPYLGAFTDVNGKRFIIAHARLAKTGTVSTKPPDFTLKLRADKSTKIPDNYRRRRTLKYKILALC